MSKTQIFIEKARAKHGDKFDYSKTVYVNAKANVNITCPVHGTFSQRAHSHLNTQHGCRECSIAPRAKSNRVSNADFIKTCVEKHGQTYDYTQTKYTIRTAQIDVRCRIHGNFKIRAGVHADGGKCQKCTPNAPTGYDNFVLKARSVHGDKYIYNDAYISTRMKVIVKCKNHGYFNQTPAAHLQGQGCPKCAPSPFDRDQSTAIYLMQMGSQVKIGISIDPESRLSQINRHNPEPARIVTTWALKDFQTAYAMEQELHQRLCNYHAGLTGFDGATEWFNTTPCHAEWIINKTLLNANLM